MYVCMYLYLSAAKYNKGKKIYRRYINKCIYLSIYLSIYNRHTEGLPGLMELTVALTQLSSSAVT